jgi:hypothetical protein
MLKDTAAEEVAVYIFTGMETSPNEIVPEPMECGGMVETIPRGDTRFASSAARNR